MADELGPFQALWDAWNEVHDEMMKKDLPHFVGAIQIQLDELQQHRQLNNREAAAREAIDIISIALNYLRQQGYQSEEIAELARSRAERRMLGRTKAILKKYQDEHGI